MADTVQPYNNERMKTACAQNAFSTYIVGGAHLVRNYKEKEESAHDKSWDNRSSQEGGGC